MLLLLSGLLFIAWAGTAYALLLLSSVIANFFLGRLVDKKENPGHRIWMVVAVVFNLLLLVVFKYSAFLVSNVNTLSDLVGLPAFPLPDWALPLGISFYIFRILSYHFEVRRGLFPPRQDFVSFALYVTFFPQVSAGPIVRYSRFSRYFGRGRPAREDVYSGLQRFILGLIKKVLLANSFAVMADAVWRLPAEELTFTTSWLGILSYTLLIYYDFSAYSDMAIGLSGMLGFPAPENFNYPYKSRSVKDFWMRWHMTLTQWFRDFLFLPLAYSISRKMPEARYFSVKTEKWVYSISIVITWFLVGLWHGATWTFIAWGGVYGLFLMAEHLWYGRKLNHSHPVIRHFYTLLVIMLAWVFFRSVTFNQGFAMIGGLMGLHGMNSGLFEYYRYLTPGFILTFFIGLAGAAGWWERLLRYAWKTVIGLRSSFSEIYKLIFRIFVFVLLLVGLGLSTAEILRTGFTPFIYFQF